MNIQLSCLKCLKNKYAEIVPDSEVENVLWYLPHHGVYNQSKRKLRIVFDCSAKFKGVSLNDCLLQGPDLTNSLLGVLLRFRKERFAFSCDIQKMYYQFRVPKSDRNYMGFFCGGSMVIVVGSHVFYVCVFIRLV